MCPGSRRTSLILSVTLWNYGTVFGVIGLQPVRNSPKSYVNSGRAADQAALLGALAEVKMMATILEAQGQIQLLLSRVCPTSTFHDRTVPVEIGERAVTLLRVIVLV